MKILNGLELADFIKVRQLKTARNLRQEHKLVPKLAIIQTIDRPEIDLYVKLKRLYGNDIMVEVEVHQIKQPEARALIKQLNQDSSIHGVIIQLPLADTAETNELLNLVDPKKDVDGLGESAIYDPATPTAINWLLTGYNIDLNLKQIVIVGAGRLVGEPLAHMWQRSGLKPTVLTKDSSELDLKASLREAEVIVSAAGRPELISSDLVRPGAVVVDAGTASEDGQIVGDVAASVRTRHDVIITPEKGGVGPLTVSALFDNVLKAARASI